MMFVLLGHVSKETQPLRLPMIGCHRRHDGKKVAKRTELFAAAKSQKWKDSPHLAAAVQPPSSRRRSRTFEDTTKEANRTLNEHLLFCFIIPPPYPSSLNVTDQQMPVSQKVSVSYPKCSTPPIAWLHSGTSRANRICLDLVTASLNAICWRANRPQTRNCALVGGAAAMTSPPPLRLPSTPVHSRLCPVCLASA